MGLTAFGRHVKFKIAAHSNPPLKVLYITTKLLQSSLQLISSTHSEDVLQPAPLTGSAAYNISQKRRPRVSRRPRIRSLRRRTIRQALLSHLQNLSTLNRNQPPWHKARNRTSAGKSTRSTGRSTRWLPRSW